VCGIFGAVIQKSSSHIPRETLSAVVKDLFLESERRGKEASGSILIGKDTITTYKIPKPAPALWTDNSTIFDEILTGTYPLVFVGHTRLATNGDLNDNRNNQPVGIASTFGVHNGIIVNDVELWSRHNDLRRTLEIDTEIIIALFEKYIQRMTPREALATIYSEIKGTASIAVSNTHYDELFLATNTGSLYLYEYKDRGVVLFASELRILKKVCSRHFGKEGVFQKLSPQSYASIHLDTGSLSIATLGGSGTHENVRRATPRVHTDSSSYTTYTRPTPLAHESLLRDSERLFMERREEIKKLRRCTRCILPETFPLISYNADGVCNYCTFYQPIRHATPHDLVEKIRTRTQGNAKNTQSGADLIMGFSGGRDSCYGLHYLTEELGLRPIAYTYDWGVITDLGRRNQSRFCAQLGVEHIIVSADIRKKRSYIRKNIEAWAHNPDLGLIPLFMAGDKQYFHYLNELSRDLGIQSLLLCENPLERTHFKQGFAGITHKDNTIPPYASSLENKLQMALYYGKQFAKNPRYLNASIIDTLHAYISYYFIPHEYLYLFDYLSWNENEVNKILIEKYDWELAPDTESTWRIGDGTAPFYNYIYYLVAGFTENDTLRSNQIREGHLTRDEALTLAERDNAPRWESLFWYFDTIGIRGDQILKVIHAMKPLWHHQ